MAIAQELMTDVLPLQLNRVMAHEGMTHEKVISLLPVVTENLCTHA